MAWMLIVVEPKGGSLKAFSEGRWLMKELSVVH